MTRLVERAIQAYKEGDSDKARSCYMQMTPDERDLYLTSVRELISVRSD